jgi:methyl-accepting chemotaxis protein
VISNAITGSVKRAVEAAENLSEGDLTIQFEQNEMGDNEMGRLLGALQTTTSGLRKIIHNMSDASASLSEASIQLTGVTSNSLDGCKEQLKMTDQTAVAMNEMAATVQDIATNAGNAAEIANDANNEAEKGNQVTRKTIESIRSLEGEITNTSSSLSELAQEADNIGSILDVIRAIADQTNLLALNAAIEAARAGEQGRGFSVVADEVRSLAQRTQESTEEIQLLIERLQKGTHEAVATMNKSQRFVESSVNDAGHSGDVLNAIAAAIAKINDSNTHIASASEQQSITAEQINQNIVVVNKVSQRNAEEAESIVDSSRELSELADKLSKAVSHFKL